VLCWDFSGRIKLCKLRRKPQRAPRDNEIMKSADLPFSNVFLRDCIWNKIWCYLSAVINFHCCVTSEAIRAATGSTERLLQSRRHCCLELLLIRVKTAQQRPILYSNTVIGTLAVDGWAVTFGTVKRGLGGCGPALSPPLCTKCNSPPINSQCTNFIIVDVALYLPLHYKGLRARYALLADASPSVCCPSRSQIS